MFRSGIAALGWLLIAALLSLTAPSAPAQNLPRIDVAPRVEKLPAGEIQTLFVPAGLAFSAARRSGFEFHAERRSGLDRIRCQVRADRSGIELIVRYQGTIGGFDFGAMNLPQLCVFRLFGAQSLAAGWVVTGDARVHSSNDCARRDGNMLIGPQRRGGGLVAPVVAGNPFPERPRLLLQALVNLNDNTCTQWRWQVEEFRMKGPAGADWRQAFQR